MNEIDFIPDWYKADRLRKRQNVRYSTLLGTLFVIMVLWSLIVGKHVQHVAAEVEEVQAAFNKSTAFIDQVQSLNEEIRALKQKSDLLDRIVPRTPITSIIGELSSFIDEDIVLSKLALKYEPINEFKDAKEFASKAIVQTVVKPKHQDIVVPDAPSRLRIQLTGIASTPASAANLIVRLENTAYFEQVVLAYSKPKTFQQQEVTEFEISCIVADYRIRSEKEVKNEI